MFIITILDNTTYPTITEASCADAGDSSYDKCLKIEFAKTKDHAEATEYALMNTIVIDADGKPHTFKGTLKDEKIPITFTLPDPDDDQPKSLVCDCDSLHLRFYVSLHVVLF